ncbi:hypothetical protein T484DRAFT_1883543 [Baffinella frigidus]|nr:hypothetical protein T484DRAFT_1883543 [Cryptophyta sp. CCMP2293]
MVDPGEVLVAWWARFDRVVNALRVARDICNNKLLSNTAFSRQDLPTAVVSGQDVPTAAVSGHDGVHVRIEEGHDLPSVAFSGRGGGHDGEHVRTEEGCDVGIVSIEGHVRIEKGHEGGHDRLEEGHDTSRVRLEEGRDGRDGRSRVRIEEDDVRTMQRCCAQCHSISDVPEVLEARTILAAVAALEKESAWDTILSNLSVCGHVRYSPVVDTCNKSVDAHRQLEVELDFASIKNLLNQHAWISGSPGKARTISIFHAMEQMEDLVKKKHSSPNVSSKAMMTFMQTCGTLQGSTLVNKVVQIARAIASLELPDDECIWSEMTGVAKPVHPDAITETTSEISEIADGGVVTTHSALFTTHPGAHEAGHGVCRWDVGELMDGVGACWVVVDDVVSRGKKFLGGLDGLVRVSATKIDCTVVRLRDAMRRCGPVSGVVSARRVMTFVRETTPNEDTKSLLGWALLELDEPGTNISFDGWAKVHKVIAGEEMPDLERQKLANAVALLRAARCIQAVEIVEGDECPWDVKTLWRLILECESVPMSEKLDAMRKAIMGLASLPFIKDVDRIRAILVSCQSLSGDDRLAVARDRMAAVEGLDEEDEAVELSGLLGRAGTFEGAAALDRARGWLSAENELRTERRHARMISLYKQCGKLRGSEAMDHAKALITACASLSGERDTETLRTIVATLQAENVSESDVMDEVVLALRIEESLPEISEIEKLITALLRVDGRLTASVRAEAARQHLKIVLLKEWVTVVMCSELPVLRKFVELMADVVAEERQAIAEGRGTLWDGREMVEAWDGVARRVAAADSLDGEFDVQVFLRTLVIVGEMTEAPVVARALFFASQIAMLSTDSDYATRKTVVAHCEGLVNCKDLSDARDQVEAVTRVSVARAKKPDRYVEYEDMVRCVEVCGGVTGNQVLEEMRLGDESVKRLKLEVTCLDDLDEFRELWDMTGAATIIETARVAFDWLGHVVNAESNETLRQKLLLMRHGVNAESNEILRQKLLLMRSLDADGRLKKTVKWLHEETSLRQERSVGFVTLSVEKRLLTFSTQTHAMQRFIDKAFFVKPSTSRELDRAREALGYLRPKGHFARQTPQVADTHLSEELLSQDAGKQMLAFDAGKQMLALVAMLRAAVESKAVRDSFSAVEAEAAIASLFEQQRARPSRFTRRRDAIVPNQDKMDSVIEHGYTGSVPTKMVYRSYTGAIPGNMMDLTFVRMTQLEAAAAAGSVDSL